MRTLMTAGFVLLGWLAAQAQENKAVYTDAASEERIQRLISELGADRLKIRDQATEGLTGIGEPALAPLKNQLDSKNPEVRWRAQRIVTAIRQKLADRDLKLMVTTDKKTYTQGESITVIVKLVNTGEEPVIVHRGLSSLQGFDAQGRGGYTVSPYSYNLWYWGAWGQQGQQGQPVAQGQFAEKQQIDLPQQESIVLFSSVSGEVLTELQGKSELILQSISIDRPNRPSLRVSSSASPEVNNNNHLPIGKHRFIASYTFKKQEYRSAPGYQLFTHAGKILLEQSIDAIREAVAEVEIVEKK